MLTVNTIEQHRAKLVELLFKKGGFIYGRLRACF
nr:MAG TPA: hypothetical protein [Caudoviricetes sp.]